MQSFIALGLIFAKFNVSFEIKCSIALRVKYDVRSGQVAIFENGWKVSSLTDFSNLMLLKRFLIELYTLSLPFCIVAVCDE